MAKECWGPAAGKCLFWSLFGMLMGLYFSLFGMPMGANFT